MGAIPIVNENGSVIYTEIESKERLFGDNDRLSAVAAVLCRASKLIIFSDIDGLYHSDPRLHPNTKLVNRIDKTDESVYSLAGGAGSRRGTGGMKTKLHISQGTDVITANGNNPYSLYDILGGKNTGTLFAGYLTKKGILKL